MNNPTPTPTTPNTTSTPNASAPKTDEKNPSPQANPQAIGGDQKIEPKTEVVKENIDIKAS